ncbi:MAG: hypothetical protein JSW45_05890 [Thiotrichales bacterium]|nr:MAG: hypothetical protein JSW45_05890 [Thiotrichales bacterium]
MELFRTWTPSNETKLQYLADIQLARRYGEYYHPVMHKQTRNMINWIVIAMMVMLPLRGVVAFEQSECDMHDQSAQMVHDHSMHQLDDAMQMDVAESENCCCCDMDKQCAMDCGIGASASIIVQSVPTMPSLSGSVVLASVDHNLVFRELSPPIRPPASL